MNLNFNKPEQKKTSYTPQAIKRDDIPALEQKNYIQNRQPTYMRVSVNENFNKKTHRHWIANLITAILLIGVIFSGYYWWNNMDGKYFFRLVPLATYSDSDVSIALPKNYQIVKTEKSGTKTIKYYRDNAGDKVLAINFQIKQSIENSIVLRDNSKNEKTMNNDVVNISTDDSNGVSSLKYDVKNASVVIKHVREMYFTGKNNSYQIVIYDDMTDSDFAGSISFIISTLEIK